MQSSQIVPGNSAHEALATLTPIQQPTFWGGAFVCVMPVLHGTALHFVE